MPRSAHSRSSSCCPVAARLRRPNSRSVKALPLSFSTHVIFIGAARAKSRKKRRALAVVCAGFPLAFLLQSTLDPCPPGSQP